MIEKERIIRKGVLPASFFDEEIRCDFLVTEERKKIWAVLLDMLLSFNAVCEKHDLRYFLIGGTLLGAIRHKGFIPWDDDIDLGMPRKDYEILLSLRDEFEPPLFFQTPYTDPGYFFTPVRLRNSNTTGIVELFMYQGFNQGIWLSIFPLDAWSDVGGEDKYNSIKSLIRENSTFMRKSNPNLTQSDRARINAHSGRDPFDVYEEIQRIAKSCPDKAPRYISHATCTVNSYKRNYFYAEDFKTSELREFEGFFFPIPIGYDRVLRMAYGNYLEYPPVEQRGKWHSSAVFNPDLPYKEYIRARING